MLTFRADKLATVYKGRLGLALRTRRHDVLGGSLSIISASQSAGVQPDGYDFSRPDSTSSSLGVPDALGKMRSWLPSGVPVPLLCPGRDARNKPTVSTVRRRAEMAGKSQLRSEGTSRPSERVLDLAALRSAAPWLPRPFVKSGHRQSTEEWLATEIRGHPCRSRLPVVMDTSVMKFVK